MTAPTLRWSPHPMHRPGYLLAGLFKLGLGLALFADAFFGGALAQAPEWAGIMMATLVVAVGAAGLFFPGPRKRIRFRLVYIVALPLVSLITHFLVTRVVLPESPIAVTTTPGTFLVLAGIGVVAYGERRRRQVRIDMEHDRLTVFVRRYRLEHELPFEEVREVDASRTTWGRLWGYGDFVARVKKGTMQDRVTKPVVGETPPDDATRGNGWDEEEHFRLVAAWPYKSVRRALERRIVLARMSPKEREEQELAYRLKEDLQDLQA